MIRPINYSKIIVICLLVVSLACESSPSARISSLKLSAEELGTVEHIAPLLSKANNDLKKINDFITNGEKAKAQRNYGIADSHYAKANRILTEWRNEIIFYRKVGRLRLVYPQTMRSLNESMQALLDLSNLLPESGVLENSQLELIRSHLKWLVAEDRAFSVSTRARKSNPDLIKPKLSLMIELKPFPFKIEILHGEFKIKQSYSLGGFTATPGLGSGSRTGITKLILVHEGNARIFAVGNRKLSFEVPASRIDISGDTMTITTLENNLAP